MKKKNDLTRLVVDSRLAASCKRYIPTSEEDWMRELSPTRVPVTVNIRDGQNVTAITEASRICHVAVTDLAL